ncbi:FTR1 family protein [Oscillatoria sp. CS-180]|uniref:FTR1 family iron permease n=1 Tax=Oscillatoria sp. CS-180 TaxID=3021720 RepID=UPI00233107D3|nr:FTR1 family protein [Oscillatoria sp. CS-180]MDB9524947.1 FTR1 family protein [Oscillatoria sp. CS-180]
MDFAPALPTFFVTLREGVEAALVVGIVLACLGKAQQTQLNRWVYLGVLAGLLGSVFTGVIIFNSVAQVEQSLPTLEPIIEPFFDSLFCAIAIIMLSWMLLWMTRQARSLKSDIEGSISAALVEDEAAGLTIFSLVCIAVLREGIETVLFIFTSVQQSGTAALGAVGGLFGATLIGLALFRWGIRINLRVFFQVMGVLLLLIIGGLVVSFFRNLDAAFLAISSFDPVNADLCISKESCILGPLLWDAHNVLPDRQFPGILLKTLLGYRDRLFAGQALAYLAFMIAIGGTYFRSLTPPTQQPQKSSL